MVFVLHLKASIYQEPLSYTRWKNEHFSMAMNFFITCTHKDSDLQTLQKFTAAPCCSSKCIFSLCDLSVILLSIQITQMFLRVLNSIPQQCCHGIMNTPCASSAFLTYCQSYQNRCLGLSVFCFVHFVNCNLMCELKHCMNGTHSVLHFGDHKWQYRPCICTDSRM